MSTFFRQIGLQSGVQLNLISDESGSLPIDNSDQRAAIVAILDRGRIDKAFVVARSNMRKRLGAPKPLRGTNPNEAYRHIDHMLRMGTQEVIVSRVLGDFTNKFVVLSVDGVLGTSGQVITEFGDPITDELGVYLLPEIVADPLLAPTVSIRAYLSTDAGTTDDNSIIAFKLMDGITDGFKLRISIDDGGERTPTADRVFINIAILDKDNDTVLYAIRGAISMTAQDESQNSLYIGDYASAYNDVFQFQRGQMVDADLLTLLESDASSVIGMNVDKVWNLTPFIPAITDPAPIDYTNAVGRLTPRQTEFFYLTSGGSLNTTLLTELWMFGRRWNKSTRFDAPSTMTPEEACAWLATLTFDPKSYWLVVTLSMISHLDTLTNQRVRIGISGYQIGMLCARNAIKKNGYAKKQHPVAGYDYPISLPKMRMEVDLDPSNTGDGYLLDLLARYHINPVLHEDYGNDESRFVIGDSLTQYMANEKDLKLEAVAERAMNIDSSVVGIVKRLQQADNTTVVADAYEKVGQFFDDIQGAGWLEVSDLLGGKTYDLNIAKTNGLNDSIDVSYTIHYVGTNRQTFVQQTVV